MAIDVDVKISVVYDNRKDNLSLQEGWGFSCLVEWKGKTILFDTGADVNVFFSNLTKMGYRLEAIDYILFSHKHGDHIAGFLQVMEKIGKQTKVFVPTSFPHSLLRKTSVRSQIEEVSSLTKIDEGIDSLVLKGGWRLYEQALLLHTSKGVVILTGCAHPGILDIVRTVQKKIKKPIYFVMGGFHLFKNSRSSVDAIVDTFHALGVENVAPCHCSGDLTIEQFQKSYGRHCSKIGTGTVLTI